MLMAISLDVQNDIRHVLAKRPGSRRIRAENAVDLDGRDGRGREATNNSTRRSSIAEGEAKTALERLGDERRQRLAFEENSSFWAWISSCHFFWIMLVSLPLPGHHPIVGG